MAERVTRAEALAFRRRATALDRRLPRTELTRPAEAGLQDSAPRSAVLALQARVEDVAADDWRDARLVQLWGPRGAVWVVRREDVAVFTHGRLPRDDARRAAIARAARRVRELLADGPRSKNDLLRLPGAPSMSRLLEASMGGGMRLVWDGRDTIVHASPPLARDLEAARLELARRYLRTLGPSDAGGFARWAGIEPADARATLAGLADELAPVEVEGAPALLLAGDLPALREADEPAAVRLLPPGDPYLNAADRALVAPDRELRDAVFPPNAVWPGAILAGGEVVGTWLRRGPRVQPTVLRALPRGGAAALQDEVDGIASLLGGA